MTVHELKCWPAAFRAVRQGTKTFELRENREPGFAIGDILWLREYDPDTGLYPGGSLLARVNYVLPASEVPLHPLPEGWVAMSIQVENPWRS